MRVAHHRVGEFYYCRFERFFGCRQPFFILFYLIEFLSRFSLLSLLLHRLFIGWTYHTFAAIVLYLQRVLISVMTCLTASCQDNSWTGQ